MFGIGFHEFLRIHHVLLHFQSRTSVNAWPCASKDCLRAMSRLRPQSLHFAQPTSAPHRLVRGRSIGSPLSYPR